jgi:hypothetical protein
VGPAVALRHRGRRAGVGGAVAAGRVTQGSSKLVEVGRPFSAHEVLEARWKAGPDRERDLWQGLAQICVGLTHAARGNTIGATRLLERGAARIDAYAAGGGPAYGLDLTAVAACARGNTGTAC